jgi:hypothetical protein
MHGQITVSVRCHLFHHDAIDLASLAINPRNMRGYFHLYGTMQAMSRAGKVDTAATMHAAMAAVDRLSLGMVAPPGAHLAASDVAERISLSGEIRNLVPHLSFRWFYDGLHSWSPLGHLRQVEFHFCLVPLIYPPD